MSIITVIEEVMGTRGSTFITRIKQDLRSAGKSATGELIKETKGEVTVNGNVVTFEGKAPDYYIFVDEGRRPGAKPPPVNKIDAWIRKRGLDLNAYAVAKSIGKKGIKGTNIYTDNIEKFIKEINLEEGLRTEIIKDIKSFK